MTQRILEALKQVGAELVAMPTDRFVEMFAHYQTSDSADLLLKADYGSTYADEDLEPAQLESLVKLQIPAILFPYIRAAMTSFLANAGFPGVHLPLINVQRFAAGQDLQLEELKGPSSAADQP